MQLGMLITQMGLLIPCTRLKKSRESQTRLDSRLFLLGSSAMRSKAEDDGNWKLFFPLRDLGNRCCVSPNHLAHKAPGSQRKVPPGDEKDTVSGGYAIPVGEERGPEARRRKGYLLLSSLNI